MDPAQRYWADGRLAVDAAALNGPRHPGVGRRSEPVDADHPPPLDPSFLNDAGGGEDFVGHAESAEGCGWDPFGLRVLLRQGDEIIPDAFPDIDGRPLGVVKKFQEATDGTFGGDDTG